MGDRIPQGIKISDFPIATDVAADDYIPILDTNPGIIKRTTASHSSKGSEWGLGNESEYGHVKLVNNTNSKEFNSGESLAANQGYEVMSNFGEIEISNIAEYDHAKDSYFVFDGKLVQALRDIVVDDQIIMGTNIIAKKVSDLLHYIDGKISEHLLELDIVVRNGQCGYIDLQGKFVAFKSQADIDAAVAAAIAATKLGNATTSDVLTGKTFTNHLTSGLTGTMPNRGAVSQLLSTTTTQYTVPLGYHNGNGSVNISLQEKTITSSRSAQIVTPDSGKVLSKVTVNKYPDAEGTYTYPADSTGGTVDMGATNNLRYVNASSVYAKGKYDGTPKWELSNADDVRYYHGDSEMDPFRFTIENHTEYTMSVIAGAAYLMSMVGGQVSLNQFTDSPYTHKFTINGATWDDDPYSRITVFIPQESSLVFKRNVILISGHVHIGTNITMYFYRII